MNFILSVLSLYLWVSLLSSRIALVQTQTALIPVSGLTREEMSATPTYVTCDLCTRRKWDWKCQPSAAEAAGNTIFNKKNTPWVLLGDLNNVTLTHLFCHIMWHHEKKDSSSISSFTQHKPVILLLFYGTRHSITQSLTKQWQTYSRISVWSDLILSDRTYRSWRLTFTCVCCCDAAVGRGCFLGWSLLGWLGRLLLIHQLRNVNKR